MTVTRVPPSAPEHTSRDPDVLAANVTDVELVTTGPRGGHLTQGRWVVDVSYVKPQYGKPWIVTVFSPCCGGKRQQISHGYAFSCPGCGWWWRYHCLGWTHRIVSLGKEKPA